ncbi:hypothetical protein TSTA_125100 [Talaromyces stipitatus ATCC 10500]|uniref:Uncharacterized protein n=1 Tax=Talaromyces stipitatus (strain ATCC 10500 / CBS 375.48 / QM 6759 / NRRL 1006) TaxID=441959 RepID=B8MCH6_TALSN|nr:uncharacterized protein TSTA_125100 [Talaromyces stipitatus ATCC 10500]EED18792.1 hypothetical protein TSTA_125100 [Talaromyces stipitatus ATCC 10500]
MTVKSSLLQINLCRHLSQNKSSIMETVVSLCTRALDYPDVPLLISSTKFIINIILNLLIISKFHVGSFTPAVNMQALIRLACDMASAFSGLMDLIFITFSLRRPPRETTVWGLVFVFLPYKPTVTFAALKNIARTSVYTFTESANRNAVYIWLVNRIILLGENYATAWGFFNTIGWCLIMVPIQTLEASMLTFVWGKWRALVSVEIRYPKASRAEILVVICIALSTHGIQSFAYFLSGSKIVAQITQLMWKTIDRAYIFYALDYRVAAILLAACPRSYFHQALDSNILWMLPWAIVATKVLFPEATAWTYYAIVFGDALVFDFIDVSITLLIWAFQLSKGKSKLISYDELCYSINHRWHWLILNLQVHLL